MKETSLYVQG